MKIVSRETLKKDVAGRASIAAGGATCDLIFSSNTPYLEKSGLPIIGDNI